MKTMQTTYKSNDDLIWSIINILCFSLIFGQIALYFSIQTIEANYEDNAEDPDYYSNKARIVNIIATVSEKLIDLLNLSIDWSRLPTLLIKLASFFFSIFSLVLNSKEILERLCYTLKANQIQIPNLTKQLN
ncbi:hypothetical protein BpHYR1_042552 [Brachionus plicatilis]|uniref:Uncharacterized protein n=1 Tax=Brachionus plicatilis TaxID=10195 RepID=A0A3M7RWX9_BRAPC|nr:hypothetical protein BpHYR1_042552 [Brachionus plicatilis]